ncbi:hypothetical protein PTSG_09188 [Salpingoeca rosetta]|uniref:Uncharacterized protein n=1 Tax=Salpingoeca rosetta (strain ATCC 50818 / BSB-021) TaxID=946362 RepID=F2UMZ2_SALR5|nr:uncharacterized protein PTSG_09188 [Salpingoeca rosetta]EGD78491.1 hypothetical protein PTSG_09188 [Salpingoeca rosetta]|eukprot:XP_004989440.1 hypothetical protein PTSG_09188 [Salpingoeca rosetta]
MCQKLGRITFRDVGHIRWLSMAHGQTTLQGEVSNVGGINFHGLVELDDFALFAGLHCVRIANRHVDLAPFAGINTLVLARVTVDDQSVIADAEELHVHEAPLETDTLNAKRVTLSFVKGDVPARIHLPNATHFGLGYGSWSTHVKFVLPPRVDTITIRSVDLNIPRFEHARVLDLDCRGKVNLSALARRVDKLVIRSPVMLRTSADNPLGRLLPVPDDVHVCLDDLRIVLTESKLPPCVKELSANGRRIVSRREPGAYPRGIVTRKDASSTCLANVPLLSLSNYRLGDVGALRGRRQLHLVCVTLDGEISDCNHVSLRRCNGSAANLSGITWLYLERATVMASDDDEDVEEDNDADDNSRVPQKPEAPLRVQRIQRVSTCQLGACSVTDSSCFRNVQRLILKRCKFDDLGALTAVGCLVVRDCTSLGDEWAWPDAVLVNRTPEDMMAVLMSGRMEKV